MIVFDTTALSTIWIPGTTVSNRNTKKPIKHAKERLDLLIESIAASDDTIIIPAPVLSEIVVKIPTKADELLKRIKGSPWFKVEGFDAAADWTKVKFDRQIVAIALVANATEIISDDADVAAIGERWGVQVRSIEDLPLPEDLIPPPLLRPLEEEDEREKEQAAPQPASIELRGSGNGHSEDQAGAEEADGKEAGKE